MIAWVIAAVALSILMASIATIATDALADSEALTPIIAAFGNANDLTIAFMGAGLVFTVILLLIMATVGIGSIRNDESRGYLDTILAQPTRRASWLTKRLLLTALTSIATGIVSCIATWAIASAQNIPITLGDILLVGIALSGTVLFAIGFGTLLYGIVPRFATAGMYIIIAWSAIIDMIRSSVEINEWVVKTSLFHYVSISPVEMPDWTTFAWLVGLGLTLAAIGVVCFSRRDIISE